MYLRITYLSYKTMVLLLITTQIVYIDLKKIVLIFSP